MTQGCGRRVLLIFFSVLLGAGCATVMERVGLLNCQYSLEKVTPHVGITIPVSQSAVTLDFEVKVTNPNSSRVTLDHLLFDLFVNDTKVTSGDSRQQKSIEASSEGAIEIESRFTYEELKDTFLMLTESVRHGEAKYEIKGTAFYETAFGPLSFPVTIRKGEVGR
jgi:LEA14-like dessication related protein